MPESADHPETVGPFSIESELGRGGMGVVYLGRDDRLGRRVAIKVLPNAFPTEEMSLRFEREARTAAQLNHAHIATIHEIGRDGDTTYIAMEYVEGRSLHDVIGKRALHVRDLLRIARTIAEGLAAAHARGIVHRDIKPANIMVDNEGNAKILDFGLAKPMAGAIEKSNFSDTMVTAALENLSERMTIRGQVMGTVAYMSPEQAKGAEVDSRTDIFALGVVMYEMAAGRPPFEGDTSVTTIAKIIESEPKPIGEVNPNLPPDIERIINRCLRKHPSERYQSAADLAHDLQDAERAVAELSTRTLMAGGGRLRKQAKFGWGHIAAGVAIGALAAAIVVGLLPIYKMRAGGAAASVTFSIAARHMAAAVGEELDAANFWDLELSPDATMMAMRLSGPNQRLYLREFDSLSYRVVPGSEGASDTQFSPDGQWVLYRQRGDLRRAPVAGGPALTVVNSSDFYVDDDTNSIWLEDDTVVVGQSVTGLYRVPVSGGVPQLFAATDATRKLFGFEWIARVPGRSDVVLAGMWTGPTAETYAVVAASLVDGKLEVVLDRAAFPHVSADGRLFFQRGSTILVAPFDLQTLKLTGEPETLLESIDASVWGGQASFGISTNGDYYYIAGDRFVANRRIIRFSVEGEVSDTGLPRGDFAFNLQAAPADDRIAISTLTRNLELWVIDLATRARNRVVSEYEAYSPAWSPDGERLAFSAEVGDDQTPLYKGSTVQIVDLTRDGKPVSLPLPVSGYYPQSWSPDGSALLIARQAPTVTSNSDLVCWMFEDETLVPFLETEHDEWNSTFSPDGKWVAYLSTETGQTHVYVRAFPNDGRRYQVSRETSTSVMPMWSPDGATIFWVSNHSMMRASFSTEGGVRVGAPEEVFTSDLLRWVDDDAFSRAHDGSFLFIEPPAHALADAYVNIVLHPRNEQ